MAYSRVNWYWEGGRLVRLFRLAAISMPQKQRLISQCQSFTAVSYQHTMPVVSSSSQARSMVGLDKVSLGFSLSGNPCLRDINSPKAHKTLIPCQGSLKRVEHLFHHGRRHTRTLISRHVSKICLTVAWGSTSMDLSKSSHVPGSI